MKYKDETSTFRLWGYWIHLGDGDELWALIKCATSESTGKCKAVLAAHSSILLFYWKLLALYNVSFTKTAYDDSKSKCLGEIVTKEMMKLVCTRMVLFRNCAWWNIQILNNSL